MRGSIRTLFMLAATAVVASCITPAVPREVPSAVTLRLPLEIRVGMNGRVARVPLEEYILGSVLAEVSPVGETAETTARIFEVQAVLARTYAVAHLGRHASDGFDLCDTTHCQLYDPQRIRTSRFAAIAREAVARTAGRILVFDGRPIDALFHSDCGGRTTTGADVWGGAPLPYLAGGLDDVPAGTHRTWRVDLSLSQIRKALNADPATAVGARLDSVAISRLDESGRAAEIRVSGTREVRLRGDDFRRRISNAFGDRTLQSTRFTLARAGAGYRFTGSGFGHGVGLCQVGAAARARRGDSLEAILRAYFPKTDLTAGR